MYDDPVNNSHAEKKSYGAIGKIGLLLIHLFISMMSDRYFISDYLLYVLKSNVIKKKGRKKKQLRQMILKYCEYKVNA